MFQRFIDEGFLVEAGVETLILSNDIKIDGLIAYAKAQDAFIISKSLIENYTSSLAKPAQQLEQPKTELVLESKKPETAGEPKKAEPVTEPPAEPSVNIQRPIFRALASEFSSKIEHIADRDVSGKSTCTGTVDDFISLFRDRYRKISSIMKLQPSQNPVVNYNGMKNGERCRFIGMVRTKTLTKNGHLILEVEDEHGVVKAFIGNRNKELMSVAASAITDEVLAFDGAYKDPFFYVDAISWPEVPLNKQKKYIDEDLSIAFLSDVHVGSKFFMEKNFIKMLDWLNGACDSEREREIVSSIKYICIAGDLVDGIGVYPNQESELTILDIYDQYKAFFALLDRIPDYIDVFLIPGNHDAVRRGDPQPSLPKEFVNGSSRKFHFGSSPSWFKIEGLNTLMYHGTSIDSMIANVSGLSYAEPEKVMVEYLKRRHLSPIYGANHIIPEHDDFMVVDEVPDILHMGHVHKNGYTEYRNVSVINSGTWQNTTDYQKMMGHIPSPCLMPVYNMKGGTLKLIDFNMTI